MTPAEITKLANIVAVALPEVMALAQLARDLIAGSGMPEEDKEVLLSRIRTAQNSVPEWV